jgi:hypothetical protein
VVSPGHSSAAAVDGGPERRIELNPSACRAGQGALGGTARQVTSAKVVY